MNPKTIGTYFSGMGFVEIGAMAAGVEPVFGVEYDPDRPDLSAAIADAHEANIPGTHLLRVDVCHVDPAELPRVDWFHASPVCKNFSLAKKNGTEDETDIATAEATARYIRHHKPPFVTIENVWMYRKSRSWQIIFGALDKSGYGVRVQKVNMADYGVPQTRIRMIVTAGLGYTPRRLRPTHQENPQETPSLFDVALPRWVSWYEAIEDLIPDLPDSELAPWQLDRLPEHLVSGLIMTGNTNRMETDAVPGRGFQEVGQPANTVIAGLSGGMPKAILLPGGNSNGGSDRNGSQPAATVGDTERVGNTPRLWLINDADSRNPYIPGERPSGTLVANDTGGSVPRLFVDGKLSTSGDKKTLQVAGEDRPDRTILTSHAAFRDGRIQLPGTVKKLTPRALARLQTIPDWVVLPEKSRIAVSAIGNGVPCLFMQRLAEQLVVNEGE
jgi:site-specific DNA-cytosine methylase